MNTQLRKKAENIYEKDFFKLMNNAVFKKTVKNVRNHRNIKLLSKEKRRNYLVLQPNNYTKKNFLKTY